MATFQGSLASCGRCLCVGQSRTSISITAIWSRDRLPTLCYTWALWGPSWGVRRHKFLSLHTFPHSWYCCVSAVHCCTLFHVWILGASCFFKGLQPQRWWWHQDAHIPEMRPQESGLALSFPTQQPPSTQIHTQHTYMCMHTHAHVHTPWQSSDRLLT